MSVYPYKFVPIYKEKIWGGRNLERLFGRKLPEGKKIGESWELADLVEGTSVVANGPDEGKTLTELTHQLGPRLLGPTRPLENGRFPLLLKLLDANDTLSLQVHPDAEAVREIGPPAALKTECWFVLDSRNGYIYKGVNEGVGPREFRKAIETETCEKVVKRYDVAAGDFHFLPAGTVHTLGGGVVVAEAQTPSDTTYRVTDWGRGREIHVERSMQCIRFEPAGDQPPGESGETLLVTGMFSVSRRSLKIAGGRGGAYRATAGNCQALMFIAGAVEIRHNGEIEPVVPARAGDTVLLPAGLGETEIVSQAPCEWLEVTLPNG